MSSTFKVTKQAPSSFKITLGPTVYWSSSEGGDPGVNTYSRYEWANTHTYNSDIIFNGAVYAGNSAGLPGQILSSNGSGVQWIDSLSTVVSQQFTANGTANSFIVAGGYIPDTAAVFVNGVKQSPVDVNISSGNVIDFYTPPGAGSLIDIFAYATAISTTRANTSAAYYWTNTHNFEANVTYSASIIANGTPGSTGHVLTSNGSGIFWGQYRLDNLADVVEISPANNATLVYNTQTDKYEVKEINLDGGSF